MGAKIPSLGELEMRVLRIVSSKGHAGRGGYNLQACEALRAFGTLSDSGSRLNVTLSDAN